MKVIFFGGSIPPKTGGEKAKSIRETMERGILMEPTCRICRGIPVSFKHFIQTVRRRLYFLRNKIGMAE